MDEADKPARKPIPPSTQLIAVGALVPLAAWIWWSSGADKFASDKETHEMTCAILNEYCAPMHRNAAPFIVAAVVGGVLFLAGIILHASGRATPAPAGD
jgi:hypothetical protein